MTILNPLNKDLVKISGLHWRHTKKSEYHKTPEQWSLICDCHINDKIFSFMSTCLGYVRKKNDGRFEWFIKRKEKNYTPKAFKEIKFNEPLQGVKDSLEEAMKVIESNFNLNS